MVYQIKNEFFLGFHFFCQGIENPSMTQMRRRKIKKKNDGCCLCFLVKQRQRKQQKTKLICFLLWVLPWSRPIDAGDASSTHQWGDALKGIVFF